MEAKGAKQLLVIMATLAVVIGAILGLTYAGRTLWGSDVGGECSEDFSCKPGSICISKRCRRSCSVDADCQPGWMCRGTSVSVTKGGDASKGFKLTSVNICFSPEAMAPALARERAKDLEKKRRDVRLEVIVKMTTTPPQLTDAEFDGAWFRIPEAERAAGTVSALAGRVIALARPR